MNIPECKHYQRQCIFVTPCCNKLYGCRLCHDENEEHKVNRNTIKTIICIKCTRLQKPRIKCENCGTVFGNKYACLECNLFDNNDNGQYHCEKCGLCRVGGVDNFFHCDKCDICLVLHMRGRHRCVEKASRQNCPICIDDMHSSTSPLHIPDCGHFLHKACYDQLIQSGIYACPTCQNLLLNP